MTSRAAEATLAAFRELGDHLVSRNARNSAPIGGVVQDKLAMEHEVIRLALEQANGRISQAARVAGMSWQGLSYALRTRHKDLLHMRKPVRHRKQRA